MSHSNIERRQQPRRAYSDALFVSTLDEPKVTFPCQTLDISAEGLRLSADRSLAVGRPVQLWLRLASQPGTFLLRGQIRWCEAVGAGYSLGVAIEAGSGDGRDWKALLMPLAGIKLSLDAD
ncbi:PilZ domain-containing protein [Thiofaba sp. EF100]|uniref:PilZ domain-containing protein n=1 Tax=Thiofaba sp. EF100 TaxID=3121274 RepID=UPI0032216E12